jgi:hypothetical protein
MRIPARSKGVKERLAPCEAGHGDELGGREVQFHPVAIRLTKDRSKIARDVLEVDAAGAGPARPRSAERQEPVDTVLSS